MVQATAIQVHLLWSFITPQTLDSALHNVPTDRENSLSFLLKCRATGILRPTNPDTSLPSTPDRVPNPHTFAECPAYDPDSPPFFAFLGVPSDSQTTGQPGTRFGPTIIRSASLSACYTLDPLTQVPLGFYDFSSECRILSGASMADAGDIYIAPGDNMEIIYPRITRVIQDLCDSGCVPLIMGGDHSITAAIIGTLSHEPLQIIHLDAHMDFGPLEDNNLSSIHHGNVFTYILENESHVEHLHQIGLRGIVEASVEPNISDKVSSVGMDRIRSPPNGLFNSLSVLVPTRSTYLSIDIDVLDPAFASHTGTPVSNGFFPSEMRLLIRHICEHFRVVGVDVVEVSGTGGSANQTGSLAVEILFTAAAGIFQQRTPDSRTCL